MPDRLTGSDDKDRFDALLDQDWSEAWDSLPEAPELVPRRKTAQVETLHPWDPVEGGCSLCWHGDGDPRCLRCGLSVGGFEVCECGDARVIGPCVGDCS
jgi:hypothetical protein